MHRVEMNGRWSRRLLSVTCAIWLIACSSPEEAEHVALPVVVDGSGIERCTTNLGYTVELSSARLVIEDLELATAGEPHFAQWLDAVAPWTISKAHAHAGHDQDGEVMGELRGRFVVDWMNDEGRVLGIADLLEGAYHSANFRLGHASDADGLASDDALRGHTALLSGTATRGGRATEFTAVIDSPLGRRLVGAPFVAEVTTRSRLVLGLQLVTVDPFEGDTLFDDIDFSALTGVDGSVAIAPEGSVSEPAASEVYNTLRRTFQTHDHFQIVASPELGDCE